MVTVLTDVIASSGAQTPEERAAAAEDWLSDPAPSILDSRGTLWRTWGREEAMVRIDFYDFQESGSLLPPDQGKSAIGLACREYDFAETVTAITIECPDGTPEQP